MIIACPHCSRPVRVTLDVRPGKCAPSPRRLTPHPAGTGAGGPTQAAVLAYLGNEPVRAGDVIAALPGRSPHLIYETLRRLVRRRAAECVSRGVYRRVPEARP